MKRILTVILTASALALAALGDENSGKDSSGNPKSDPSTNGAGLKHFDLHFGGGTPRQLVNALEQKSDKPINVVISEENAGVRLPELELRNVTVPQVLQAVFYATRKSVTIMTQNGPSQYMVGSRFLTDGPPGDAVWYFQQERPPGGIESFKPQKVCRYFQLRLYLDNFGYKVEDITTAVQTGWKMLGETNPPPALNYHKDTQLLIAVGEPHMLALIDSVLKELSQSVSPSRNGPRTRSGPVEEAKP